MPDELTRDITRRDFLKKAGRGGVIVGGTAIGAISPPKAARSWHSSDCFTEHQEKTMECIADTAVPPTEEDDGPGASDAYAWELMKDPFYEISHLIPYITLDIDSFSYLRYGKRFIDLEYEDREEVLLDREAYGGPWGILAPAYRMTIIASILPSATVVGPALTVAAVAEKAMDTILR